jgi:general secretion pathway protein G
MNKLAQKGFTLIEMLVVISIIGILATLVAANLNSARSRARDAERKSDLKNIQTALRIYYNDKSSYPASDGANQIKGCDPGTNSCTWGGEWKIGTTVYMQKLPSDPLSPSQNYRYLMGSAADSGDTDSYILEACLENKSDTNGIASDSWCPTGVMFQIKP